MMKSYFATFLVLLVVVNNRVIICNNNNTFATLINESSLGSTHLNDTLSTELPKTEIPLDKYVTPSTHRSVRPNGYLSAAQDRNTKLMNLLAARRSVLHRHRFKTHHRVISTAPLETTSKAPTDLRTLCVRNCTKNFTGRTTASCMRTCTMIQSEHNTTSAISFTSEEERSQRDTNEILFTDESSHGFFVVAKDANDTINHIANHKKGIDYKPMARGKLNTTMQESEPDVYTYFGRKIPPLRPSFVTISTANGEHPQVLEVSVSQKPSRPKSFMKFNPRDRANSAFRRQLGSAKLSAFDGAITSSISGNLSKENDYTSNLKGEKILNETVKIQPPPPEVNKQSTSPQKELASINDPTPSLLVNDEPSSTKPIPQDLFTPLIIKVVDEEETTVSTECTIPCEVTETYDENLNTEITKMDQTPSHATDDKTNLIIFVNRTMEAPYSSIDSLPENTNTTDGITVVKTTVLSSVRSTVYPILSTNKPTMATSTLAKDTPSYESVLKTVSYGKVEDYETPQVYMTEESKPALPNTSDRPLEENNIGFDVRRMNLATYVLAGLGMFPVLVVILYLAKSLILRGYMKHDEDFDVCITDQQPISPVKKIEKPNEEEDSGQYDQCSISSLDEFNRANLRLKSLLGEGNFGQVWKAEADDLSGHIGATRIVAVKTVRSGSLQGSLKEEALIMRKLGSHPNVVTLLGACVESEPHMLIMEFAMRGRLLSLLRAARSATNLLPASVPGGKSLAPLSPRTLSGFALDIATGMEYVANKRIVHRDLAARNVLIDHNGVCKICDFGMSIDLDIGRKKCDKRSTVHIMQKSSSKLDKFKLDLGERFMNHWNHGFRNHNVGKSQDMSGRRPALPIRWMAPEALQFNEFSTETDVWAFGIVLWEIATLGATPYASLSGREVVRYVLQGIRPEFPKDGRHGFFDLMSQCWHKIPDLRPTFREARLEISRLICKWMDTNSTTSDYMDVSGFSEDLEHGMLYFNQRISEFEYEI